MAKTLKEKLFEAFVAGFDQSGEGYNGEYPFRDKNRDPATDKNFLAAFERWWKSHTTKASS